MWKVLLVVVALAAVGNSVTVLSGAPQADAVFVTSWNWQSNTFLYRVDPTINGLLPVMSTGSPGWDQGVCGPDGNLYFSGGLDLRVIRVNQSGTQLTTVAKLPGRPGAPDNMYDGPDGPSIGLNGDLFFTTGGNGGLWRVSGADPTKEPVQITASFGPPHGNWGGAATAVLTSGPYAGDIVVTHHAGKVVYKISRADCPTSASTNCAEAKTFLQEGLGQTYGLSVNSQGEIFVGSSSLARTSSDLGSGWITKFAPDGTYIGKFVDLGNAEGGGIAFDSDDNLWTVTANAIFRISPSGQKELISAVPYEGVGIAICKGDAS